MLGCFFNNTVDSGIRSVGVRSGTVRFVSGELRRSGRAKDLSYIIKVRNSGFIKCLIGR